jgi:hypothetical protein
MNTDLEQHLREFGQSQRLSQSAADVMGRGDQLRRRRGKRLSLGATALALAGVSAMAGVNSLGNQERPLADPGPEQGTGLKLVNLSQPALDAATKRCAATDPGLAQAGTPVAAITTGKLTSVTYHSGSTMYTCELTEGEKYGTVMFGPWDSQTYGKGARLESYGFVTADMIAADDVPDPAGPHMTGFGFVDPDVVSVEAEIGGQTVPAAVEDGMFALWSSEPFTTEDFNNATLVATRSNGEEIVSSFPQDGDPPPGSPSQEPGVG